MDGRRQRVGDEGHFVQLTYTKFHRNTFVSQMIAGGGDAMGVYWIRCGGCLRASLHTF